MLIMKSIKVRISGVVQGVFYRASTQEKALALGVSGWVKNCSDGSVEALFEGPHSQLEQMIAWCKVGPDNARVDKIDILYSKDCTNLQEGFTIRYD